MHKLANLHCEFEIPRDTAGPVQLGGMFFFFRKGNSFPLYLMTAFKGVHSTKHSSGPHAFSWEMLEITQLSNCFSWGIMGNSRSARRNGLSGKKRQASRDAKSICLPNSFNCRCPAFPAASCSQQSEGRRESKANVYSRQACDNKTGMKRKEEMSDREINKICCIPLRPCSHNIMLFCKLWNW